MAIGTRLDFVIYDQEFYAGANEALQQEVDVFNASSGNTIMLSPRDIKGDFEKEAFLKSLNGIVSHRDTDSVADQTPKTMTMDEFVGVKINRKIDAIEMTLDMWKKMGYGEDEFSFKLGQQLGAEVATDYVNTAIGAAVNAANANAALNVPQTGLTPTHTNLADLFQLFGDKGQRMKTLVMHSKSHTDLVKQSISDKVTNVADVAIYDASIGTMNRRVIVTDSPELVVTGIPDTYSILGLVESGIICEESEDQTVLSELVGGKENIHGRFQREYAFNMKLKGMGWDTAAGGRNPTDAALFTGANWVQKSTDIKNCFGGVLNVN